MDRGIYVTAAGALGQDKGMGIIANNLAGGSVMGFKKDIPVFSIYNIPLTYPLSPISGGEKVFVNISGMVTDFSQGILKATGNPLDVAISGDGFFVVQTPEGRRYTRKGDFIIDNTGLLKTKDGYQVEGEGDVITLTPGEVSIEQDGTISVNGNVVGRLRLVTFPKPYPLEKVGGGLFRVSGGDVAELPAEGASIMQRHLEMSNVNTIQEMVSMINGLREYESQLKVIQGFDDITDKAIRLANNR